MKGKQSFPSSRMLIIIYPLCCLYLSFTSNMKNVEGFQSTSNKVFSVKDYGAIGDGRTDDTNAFKVVWDIACSSSLSSKILIPAKHSYLVKPIDFVGPCTSNLTLKISGTIVAPEDPHIWDNLDPHKWLYFHNVTHLTVEGGGIVNGMGRKWWARSCKINITNPCRHAPTAMTFHICKYLKVRKIKLVNSQQMHMIFSHSVHVAASNLRIIAPAASPNTDGIHITASTHVEIKHTTIRTGDDCISIVTNSSKIRVRNIVCGPGHGISIGSMGKWNSWDSVHDVSVKGAMLSNTENGVRIKTWQGGSGLAKKIRFEDMLMENVSNPIIIDQYYCDSFLPCPNQTLAVRVDDISFIGIRGTSATEEAIKFACSDDVPCERLYLEDIELTSSDPGGITTSFCWKAQGFISGQIYPPPCISTCNLQRFIDQRISSNYVLHTI